MAPYLQLLALLLLLLSTAAATQLKTISSAPAPAPAQSSSGDVEGGGRGGSASAPAPAQSSSGDGEGGSAAGTTTTTYSPSNGTGFYKGMSREFIDGHNKVRARYGAPALTWDKELALFARRWANANRKSCVPRHSGAAQYAENVFVARNAWNSTAPDAIYSWNAEDKFYDRATAACTDHRQFTDCGHFAIMVNKRYRYVGCGRAECFDAKGVFISCSYSATPPPIAPPKLD